MFLKRSLISAVSIISLLSHQLYAGRTIDEQAAINILYPQTFSPKNTLIPNYMDYKEHIDAIRQANLEIERRLNARLEAHQDSTSWTDEDITFFTQKSKEAMKKESELSRRLLHTYYPQTTYDTSQDPLSFVEITLTRVLNSKQPFHIIKRIPLDDLESFVKMHIPRDQSHTIWIAPLVMTVVEDMRRALLASFGFKADPDLYLRDTTERSIDEIVEDTSELERYGERLLQSWTGSILKVFQDLHIFRDDTFTPVKLSTQHGNPLDAWLEKALTPGGQWRDEFVQSDDDKRKMLHIWIQKATVQQQMCECLLNYSLDFRYFYNAFALNPRIDHPVPYSLCETGDDGVDIREPLRFDRSKAPFHIPVDFISEFIKAHEEMQRIKKFVAQNRARQNNQMLGLWEPNEASELRKIVRYFTSQAYHAKIATNTYLPDFFKRPTQGNGKPIPSARLRYRVTAERIKNKSTRDSKPFASEDTPYSHKDNPGICLESTQLDDFLDGNCEVEGERLTKNKQHVEALNAIRYYMEVLTRKAIYKAVCPLLDPTQFQRTFDEYPFLRCVLSNEQDTTRKSMKIQVTEKFLHPFWKGSKWLLESGSWLLSDEDHTRRHFSFETPYPEGDWRQAYKKVKNAIVIKEEDAERCKQYADRIRNWDDYRTAVMWLAQKYGFVDWTPVARAVIIEKPVDIEKSINVEKSLIIKDYFPTIPRVRATVEPWTFSDKEISTLRQIKADFRLLVDTSMKRARKKIEKGQEEVISQFDLTDNEYKTFADIILRHLKFTAQRESHGHEALFGKTPYAYLQSTYNDQLITIETVKSVENTDAIKITTVNAKKLAQFLKDKHPKDTPSVMASFLLASFISQLKHAALRANSDRCTLLDACLFKNPDPFGIDKSLADISQSHLRLAGAMIQKGKAFGLHVDVGIVPKEIDILLEARQTQLDRCISLETKESEKQKEGRNRRIRSVLSGLQDKAYSMAELIVNLTETHFHLSVLETTLVSFDKLIRPSASVFDQPSTQACSSSSSSSETTPAKISPKKATPPSQEQRERAEKEKREQQQAALNRVAQKQTEVRRQAEREAEAQRELTQEAPKGKADDAKTNQAREQQPQEADTKPKTLDNVQNQELERLEGTQPPTPQAVPALLTQNDKEVREKMVKKMLADKKAENQRRVAQQKAAQKRNARLQRHSTSLTIETSTPAPIALVEEDSDNEISSSSTSSAPSTSPVDPEVAAILQKAEARKAEEERLQREEQERIVEQNRAARAAQKRLKAEKDQQKAEAKRLAKIEADRLEVERLAKIETDRIETERLAKIEAERAEAERLAKIEADRIEAERKKELEHLAKIKADRLAAEAAAKAEALRLEKERKAKIASNLQRFKSEMPSRQRDIERIVLSQYEEIADPTPVSHMGNLTNVMTPVSMDVLVQKFRALFDPNAEINIKAMLQNNGFAKILFQMVARREAIITLWKSAENIPQRIQDMKLATMKRKLMTMCPLKKQLTKVIETETTLGTLADESKD